MIMQQATCRGIKGILGYEYVRTCSSLYTRLAFAKLGEGRKIVPTLLIQMCEPHQLLLAAYTSSTATIWVQVLPVPVKRHHEEMSGKDKGFGSET
jgi:hypothetical protein